MTPWPVLLGARCRPGAEWSPAGHDPRSGVPACPRIETEPRTDANPSPDPGVSNSQSRANLKLSISTSQCASQRARSAGLSSGFPSSARTRQYAACARRVSGLLIAIDEAFETHTRESFPTSRNAARLRLGPHAEPNSYPPGMTTLQRDRYRGRDLYCRRLPPPPTCIRRQTRKADGTVSALPHSKDRDSSQLFCGEFVAVSGRSSGAASQQLQAALQPIQDGDGRQQLGSGSSQFNRQWQSIQPRTDFLNRSLRSPE